MKLLTQFIFIFLLCPAAAFAQELALQTQEQGAQEQEVKPSASVSLQAKIVQVVLNDEHRDGVDWEAIVSDFHTLLLKKQGLMSASDRKHRLSVGEVSDEDYEVLLDALDTVGHLSQKDFEPFSVTKDEPTLQDLSVDLKDISSLKLDLLWISSPSGEPKLKITPAVGMTAEDGGVEIFKDETELRLSNDKTIVIGGLIQEEEITRTRKFPLLGDLPLVGLVFRKQGRLMQKTETIIFLTIHKNAEPLSVDDQK